MGLLSVNGWDWQQVGGVFEISFPGVAERIGVGSERGWVNEVWSGEKVQGCWGIFFLSEHKCPESEQEVGNRWDSTVG